MKKTRSRDPISESVWYELEQRDPIISQRRYVENTLKKLYSNGVTNFNERVDIEFLEKSIDEYTGPKSIKNLVAQISDATLEDPKVCSTFSDRISDLTERFELTLEELGDTLGVSHTSISNSYLRNVDSRKSNISRKVSRPFLTAYSLLFGVSPLYLLGLTNDLKLYEQNQINENFINFYAWERDEEGNYHTVPVKLQGIPVEWPKDYRPPIAALDGHTDPLINFIIAKLYDHEKCFNNRELYACNLYILPIIVAFCNAKKSMRNFLKSLLETSPLLEKMTEEQISEYESQTAMEIAYINKIFEADTEYSNLIEDLRNALKQLDIKDLELLSILAGFIAADDDMKKSTYDFLKIGGFLDKPNSYFRKWQCVQDHNGILFIKKSYRFKQ